MAPDERLQLFNNLSAISHQEFGQLLFTLNPPAGLVPGPEAPQMNRVKALLDWAEGPGGRGLAEVQQQFIQLRQSSLSSGQQTTVDFQNYLQSLVTTYQQWWQLYALTDAEGQVKQQDQARSAPFDFDLMVQTVSKEKTETVPEAETSQKQRGETERLPVLEGIRKYADDHVLLAGRPGSGKSTALIRLLLEEANSALSPNPSDKVARGKPDRIPVLVELRYWQTSILERIQAFLFKHDPDLNLDEATLTTLLRQGRFLLLIDGLNELPSEEARRDVARFEKDFAKAPMIFTTREISLGGEIGLQKKLEMQPLTEPQMRQFVGNYLGQDKAEPLLRQLKDRLRELGQTPLLLAMLCSIFRSGETLPNNLGEVFRQFTRFYEQKLKGDVPDPYEHRDDWSKLLQCLAFAMMQGPDPKQQPTELSIAIPRIKAEQILTDFLQDREPYPTKMAERFLTDLLKHHLIQTNGDQIEFRHQMIQEYFAAEQLLRLLPELSDEELKRDYLNLLKWTEPIALMLALVDEEDQALWVVNLAMDDVDLMLGARLSGSVKLGFQDTTVGWITSRNIPLLLKCQLWASCQSEKSIPELLKILEGETPPHIRYKASSVLAALNNERATFGLLDALHHEDYDVRWKAAEALGEIGNEKAIPELLIALRDPESFVRRKVAEALGDIGSEHAIQELIKILKDRSQGHDVNSNAAEALSKICANKKSISWLIEALEYERKIPGYIAKTLGCSDDNQIVQKLLNALDEDKSFVFWRAAYALGRIGCREAIPKLVKALENPDKYIRRGAIEGLGQIKDLKVIPELVKVLSDEDTDVRKSAISVLGQLGSERVVPKLVEMLEDEDDKVRLETICALGNVNSMKTVPALCKSLQDSSKTCRRSAATALGGKIDGEESIPELLIALEDEDEYVRRSIANTLGQLGSRKAVPGLVKALQDERIYNYSEKRSIVSALGKLDIDLVVVELIAALKDCSRTLNARLNVAEALGELGTKEIISELLNIRDNIDNEELCQRITITLGSLGSEEVILELIDIFKSSSFRNKCDAIKVLGVLGESGSETAIRSLISRLEDFPDAHNTRMKLIESLGFSGGRQEFIEQEVIPVLVNSLEDKHYKVRYNMEI
jgi:HEAT repeat protein